VEKKKKKREKTKLITKGEKRNTLRKVSVDKELANLQN
jgi:hypothetical protein